MPLICRCCGRDLNAIWQNNMSDNSRPLCEDCYYGEPKDFDYDADYYEDWGEWEDD